MNEIKIVEYNPSYAAALADMWNRSGENWGGEEVIRTEEDIKGENEASGNLCAYLALDGDEVVGYCSFSQYKQDVGASYIPLLNVRPDCLGKKIGKMLVLECVNRAMGEEWPRLDLYTWQGNDKAVPLYKKCGFFWEKRDDSTHLMNFIPYVMRTEAVAELFQVIDWYADNKREIIVESDGRLEGEFDYFDYTWEKNDLTLNMEFERRGRGLTCIETNDYLIRARIDKQDLVTGMDYDITYEIVNKSGKPLQIDIAGEDDMSIKYDFAYTGNIPERQEIRGTFHIDDVEEAQDKWKTHPGVVAHVTINGKKALFKVGINPKLPVKMTIGNQYTQRVIGENICYVDIENGFDTEVTVTGRLKSTELVIIDEPDITCTIEAKGKVSIPITCEVEDFGFYSEVVNLTIKTEHNTLNYSAKLRGAFRGLTGRFNGEDEEYYYIYNGSYMINYVKENNVAVLKPIGCTEDEVVPIKPPQFGKPYYKELDNKKPEYLEMISKENCEMIKAHFSLEKIPGIAIDFCIELYEEGLVKTYIEVINGSEITYDKLYVDQEFFQLWYNAHLPYDGQIVRLTNADGMMPYKWDKNKITENWVFSQYNRSGRCIGWDPSMKVTLNHVFVGLETEIMDLGPGETYVTKPITCASGTFASWKEFRRYMGYHEPVESVKQDFECILSDNNPFITTEKLEIIINENKKVPVQGSINIQSQANGFDAVREELTYTDNRAIATVAYNQVPEMDIVHAEIDTGIKCINRKKAAFFVGSAPVATKKYIEENTDIYEVSNGLITLKAAPGFAAGIYSMSYKGDEWLDSSFPTPIIKGWWNYWTGGMSTLPSGFSFASVYEEEKEAEFVTIEDSKGNTWSGIKTTINILKQKELKGIKMEEYFLLLPGVPMVCQFARVAQETGKYMENARFNTVSFIKEGDCLKDNWMIVNNRGQEEKYRCLDGEFDIYVKQCLVYGSNNTDYQIVRLLPQEGMHESYNTSGVNLSQDNYMTSIPHGGTKVLEPSFLTFTTEKLNEVILEDLYQITFK